MAIRWNAKTGQWNEGTRVVSSFEVEARTAQGAELFEQRALIKSLRKNIERKVVRHVRDAREARLVRAMRSIVEIEKAALSETLHGFRDSKIHPDEWASDIAVDYDLDVHDIYEWVFGYAPEPEA